MSKRTHSSAGAEKGSERSFVPARSNISQRKCACGAPAKMRGQCEECDRKHSSAQQVVGKNVAGRPGVLTPGGPAPASSGAEAGLNNRARVDAHLGHDFGQIHVLGPDQRGAGAGGEAPKGAAPKAGEKEKAPAGTTTIGAPVRKSYAVTGTTLADAAAVIEAREEAGLTEWKPKLAFNKDDQGMVTSATVTVTLTVTMPNWPGATKLSKPAKAEWDRAYGALAKHEQGHVDLVNTHLSGLGASLVGKTEAEANAAFAEAVQKLQEASDKYDVDTDHGRNNGTDLDTSIK